MSPHTQKSDIMRHKRVKKKLLISRSTATFFLPFCQKYEVSQLSDVPVATLLCVSFVIHGCNCMTSSSVNESNGGEDAERDEDSGVVKEIAKRKERSEARKHQRAAKKLK